MGGRHAARKHYSRACKLIETVSLPFRGEGFRIKFLAAYLAPLRQNSSGRVGNSTLVDLPFGIGDATSDARGSNANQNPKYTLGATTNSGLELRWTGRSSGAETRIVAGLRIAPSEQTNAYGVDCWGWTFAFVASSSTKASDNFCT